MAKVDLERKIIPKTLKFDGIDNKGPPINVEAPPKCFVVGEERIL